jgi:hypothetical protein
VGGHWAHRRGRHGLASPQDLRRRTAHALDTSFAGMLAEVGCASGCVRSTERIDAAGSIDQRKPKHNGRPSRRADAGSPMCNRRLQGGQPPAASGALGGCTRPTPRQSRTRRVCWTCSSQALWRALTVYPTCGPSAFPTRREQ